MFRCHIDVSLSLSSSSFLSIYRYNQLFKKKMAPRPEACSSLGNIVEMQIL